MAEERTSGADGSFECCGQFEEALDPNIKKAYLGYCRGLEWPFTLMVPIGGLGGDCPHPRKREAARQAE